MEERFTKANSSKNEHIVASKGRTVKIVHCALLTGVHVHGGGEAKRRAGSATTKGIPEGVFNGGDLWIAVEVEGDTETAHRVQTPERSIRSSEIFPVKSLHFLRIHGLRQPHLKRQKPHHEYSIHQEENLPHPQ